MRGKGGSSALPACGGTPGSEGAVVDADGLGVVAVGVSGAAADACQSALSLGYRVVSTGAAIGAGSAADAAATGSSNASELKLTFASMRQATSERSPVTPLPAPTCRAHPPLMYRPPRRASL